MVRYLERIMKHQAYRQLDSLSFAEAAIPTGVAVIHEADLSGLVAHGEMGAAVKSSYISPKSGSRVFVLERSSWRGDDAYVTDVWQFDCDFTDAQARRFVDEWDQAQVPAAA